MGLGVLIGGGGGGGGGGGEGGHMRACQGGLRVLIEGCVRVRWSAWANLKNSWWRAVWVEVRHLTIAVS